MVLADERTCDKSLNLGQQYKSAASCYDLQIKVTACLDIRSAGPDDTRNSATHHSGSSFFPIIEGKMKTRQNNPTPGKLSTFGRDFAASTIISAIAMVVLFAFRVWNTENSDLTGPFPFLPAWPFYTRLGIPLVALAIAVVYSLGAAIVRHLVNRRHD